MARAAPVRDDALNASNDEAHHERREERRDDETHGPDVELENRKVSERRAQITLQIPFELEDGMETCR